MLFPRVADGVSDLPLRTHRKTATRIHAQSQAQRLRASQRSTTGPSPRFICTDADRSWRLLDHSRKERSTFSGESLTSEFSEIPFLRSRPNNLRAASFIAALRFQNENHWVLKISIMLRRAKGLSSTRRMVADITSSRIPKKPALASRASAALSSGNTVGIETTSNVC
jgi:hypothetical protein